MAESPLSAVMVGQAAAGWVGSAWKKLGQADIRTKEPGSPQSQTQTPPASPTAPSGPSLSVRSLRKVHFTMSQLKVVYDISNVRAPSVEASTKERVESAFHERRRATSAGGEAKGWTAAALESLYSECCRTREEGWGLARVRQALKDSAPAPPKSLDLTGVQLTMGAAEALGDLLSVDFGLRKLVMEGCGLEDDVIKPILHALLVSGNLPTLSLANNRKLRARGWKSVAVYVRKVRPFLARPGDEGADESDRRKSLDTSTFPITRSTNAPSTTSSSP